MRLPHVGRSWKLPVKFAIDLGLWCLAGVAAFLLRLDGDLTGSAGVLGVYLLLGLPIEAALIWRFGLYRQAWRKVGVRDLNDLVAAVGVGSVVMLAVGLALYGMGQSMPRSVPLIAGAVALVAQGGARLLARIVHEQRGAQVVDGESERVLIVGAGDAGTMMARAMQRQPKFGLTPVGFLDDDRMTQRHRHVGLPVFGGIEELPAVVHKMDIDEVLIAIPSAAGTVIRRVVDLAREAKVSFRVLPGVSELLSGRVDLSEIRELKVEDLLRREPIELDAAEVAEYLRGRVVLVTGAGGSIGSELVRQIAPFGPAQVILLGRGENSLFEFDLEMGAKWPQLDRRVVVGNVSDSEKMQDVFRRFGPQVVFHAAANKHIPLMEADPDEAILNNVGGTKTLAEVALNFGVERFVNISTDKAVNPRSMVGATKAIAEHMVQVVSEAAQPGQAFVSVRFGNVLGSRGSVVPLFQEQIRRGGPITLTHPDMTRFLMTIPEASQLVVQAGALAENGAVYVLDMGEPVRIQDLAKDLIQLSGNRPGDGIEIVYTGIRPGEKLHEELFAPDEQPALTRFAKIFTSRSAGFSENGSMMLVADLLAAARERDEDRMFNVLSRIVPTYERDVQILNEDRSDFPLRGKTDAI